MRFAHVLCSSHLAISDGRYLALAVSPTRSSFTRIRSGEVLHVQSALHGSSVFCTLRGQEAKGEAEGERRGRGLPAGSGPPRMAPASARCAEPGLPGGGG
ncbi:unnamed protein product, partial [Prorocentrum cordatum]